MNILLVTGSNGLIGSESVGFFADKFDHVVGIDNNMREVFFGEEASTSWKKSELQNRIGNYIHHDCDIRNTSRIDEIFKEYSSDVRLVIHTAAQPSHDWAAREPLTDFSINANGTLNMLESTRRHTDKATFIFTSTNKVYGDIPNRLPLIEKETRWELDESHPYFPHGIDETMSVDQCKHSLFGVSKTAADLMVQEYGRYFGMNTAVFRGGCLTGPNHSGTRLHGFLSYLMRCVIRGDEYRVCGYKGKQVRDNIHSYDLINMFWHFHQNPRSGEVYNAGGSRFSNCSILEAIALCEKISGNKLNVQFDETHRIGDHKWWISNIGKFKRHFANWKYAYSLEDILIQIHDRFVYAAKRQ